MYKTKEKTYVEFLTLLSDLSVTEILGVATLLRVELYQDAERKEARDGEEIIQDIKDGFLALGRKQKRELLAAMRQVVKQQKKAKRKK